MKKTITIQQMPNKNRVQLFLYLPGRAIEDLGLHKGDKFDYSIDGKRGLLVLRKSLEQPQPAQESAENNPILNNIRGANQENDLFL